MGKIANQLNYMHVGSFFASKVTQSAGIAAIIIKQWELDWFWYIIAPIAVILIFLITGWIGVKTGLWSAYMVQQFKGSLIEEDK
jgi:hypothetical protein